MKKIILSSILLLSVFFVNAQEWKTDISNAEKEAAKGDKPIILVFEGSDWCAPCIKLQKQVWDTPTFQEYAKDHFVMLKADFPRKSKNSLPEDQKEKNSELAAKYNPQGYFPLVVILDKNGKVLGKTGYKNIDADKYITLLNSFKS
ncbi:MAG: thioredoxin family protein [Gillisia sp.]